MKVKVRTFGELIKVMDRRFNVELEEGGNINSLLDELVNTRDGLNKNMFQDPRMTILINGRNIRSLEGLETALENENTVMFVPLVVGG